MIEIKNLEMLTKNYGLVLCDVWGVVHNGRQVYSEAVEALQKLKRKGVYIALITNSPRVNSQVSAQLSSLGISEETYDAVVTSGDATRNLIAQAPRKLFHIGTDYNNSLIEGLDAEFVEEEEAQAVLCTGLSAEIGSQLEDYALLLQRLRSRNLPFICANPDIFVLYGDEHVWCAGALARAYGQLGGRTLIAGKPHKPIYDIALQKVSEARGNIAKEEILVIGDGILTDIKGADNLGVDSVYIAGGMHHKDYMQGEAFHIALLEEFFSKYGFKPSAFMEKLR